MTKFNKMLIIGCGNMAGAMLAGWLKVGFDPSRFVVFSRSMTSAPEGVELHNSPPEISDHDCVMLGFKPHHLAQFAPDYQHLAGSGVTIFSLLAGIELASLTSAFPKAGAHVRVMPNLAVRVNKSPIILAETGLSGDAQRDAVKELFGALGEAHWLEGEAQYNLATALAGSGPGFVYRFIDALAAAGEELGLDGAMARSLALSMVDGAGDLAATSDAEPATLADRVASKGGMTREGLNVLDEGDALKSLLTQTLKAAADRGDELAKLA
ncbi:MAG: pyrroline-5-carboxylate reductase [Erythrobacter sp.]